MSKDARQAGTSISVGDWLWIVAGFFFWWSLKQDVDPKMYLCVKEDY